MSISHTTHSASDHVAKEVAAMAAAGLRVIRVHGVAAPGVCRCRRGAECSTPDKHPAGSNWLAEASTTDEDLIFEWWGDGESNVGIALGAAGKGSGDAVIDIEYDSPEGEDTIARLGLDRIETPTWDSSRGVHRLFLWDSRLPNVQKVETAGLEVRIGGNGAQTQSIAPPSTHHTGKPYRWRDGFRIGDVAIAPIPPALLDLITRKTAGTPSPQSHGVAGGTHPSEPRGWDVMTGGPYGEGCRNARLTSLAGVIANSGMKPPQARAVLHETNERLCKPPLPRREVDAIARQADKWAKDAAAAREYRIEGIPGPADLSITTTLTQPGLGRRYVREARGVLRYVHGDGYHFYDGTRWLRDVDGVRVQGIAKAVADQLLAEVSTLPPSEQKGALAFSKDASCKSTINAAIELMRSEPEIALDGSALNANPDLLSVANGTIDLTGGTFREHRPDDFITEMAGVAYAPDATCPRFKQFLDEITSGNAALAGFLQRSFGYALSGRVTEHALWLHVGEGATGKSTLLRIVGALLGTYAGSAPQNFLLVNNFSGDDVKRYAALRGKRFLVIPEQGESDDAGRFNTGAIKMLTGGDEIAGWVLYRGNCVLKPTWKIHAACNKQPRTKDSSDALFRRLKVIQYLQQFLGSKEERGLADRIIADELPGVLLWCLDGFAAWRREGGLGVPPSVSEATLEYRQQCDPIGRWLAERCVMGPSYSEGFTELWRSYDLWCEEHDEHPEPSNALARELTNRGVGSRRKNGVTFRRGIALRDGLCHEASQPQPQEG